MARIMFPQNPEVLKDQSTQLTIVAHRITLMKSHNMTISARLASKGMLTVITLEGACHFCFLRLAHRESRNALKFGVIGDKKFES